MSNLESSFEPLPELRPNFDAGLDHSYYKKIEADSSGGVRWQIIKKQMYDGTRFNVAHIEPRRRRTDIALNIQTPWATQVQGLNLHLGIKAAKLGMPVRIIGPEENKSIPLWQSAFNTLQFMYEDDISDNGFSDPNYAVLEGFSRGAMIAFGMHAYAAKFKRNIIYSDSTDPCIAKHIKDLTFSEWLQLLGYIPKEGKGTVKLVGNILHDPARRHHYFQSVDLSTNGLAQFVKTGLPLFNGDAGRMAHFAPKDMHMHLRFFVGSLPNQKEIFKEILKDHQNVEFDERDGVHTEGGELETLEHLACRMSGLIFQLSTGVKPENLDYDLIHQTALAA